MITVVTGGSGSGKSAYAERMIENLGKKKRIYIATMKPWDEECRQRIERHRFLRNGKGFETVEYYRDLERISLPGDGQGRAVLLECVSNLVSNQLFGTVEEDFPENCWISDAHKASECVIRGIRRLNQQAEDLVIVTNEVFSNGDLRAEGLRDRDLEAGDFTALYLKAMGEVNVRLGALSDRVIEVVAGIPVIVKGEHLRI